MARIEEGGNGGFFYSGHTAENNIHRDLAKAFIKQQVIPVGHLAR
jgi:hypothetical protein